MSEGPPFTTARVCLILSALAAIFGLALMADSAGGSSATYDEVAYFRISCRWWRTGDQEQITRMGSPLTFWKIQQAPTLWALDRSGHGDWIDDPEAHQSRLLPILRRGALWIWALALILTATWANRLHGPKAMAFASWLFALSPNLLAHGSLLTMEMPLVAATAGVGLLFTMFLQTGDRRAFWSAAVVSGLAFSCKFTAVVIPFILGVCWVIAMIATRGVSRESRCLLGADRQARTFETMPSTRRAGRSNWALLIHVVTRMSGFVVVMLLADWAITGFAVLPISERLGDHPSLRHAPGAFARLVEVPIPQDGVGFLTQLRHQRSGGPSYLLGERRMTGWWYYYFLAMAVKTPPTFWLLVAGRLAIGRRGDTLLLVAMAAFLGITAAGSSRNYGVRYLLPIAPLAVVWLSSLVEAGKLGRILVIIGMTGQAMAVVTSHPHELSYFPRFVGGPRGGRRILADSNLDWGQGLRGLARLQRERPEFRELTLYYFGDTRPEAYGVEGRAFVIGAGEVHPELPRKFTPETRYVAVSSSLQFGPWGPRGYFARLAGIRPVRILDDATIAIYDMSDLGTNQ